MSSAASSPSRFSHVGGHACLDFVNTVAGKGGEDPQERLGSYRDLVEWSLEEGQLSPGEAERLLSLATSSMAAEAVYARGLRLRESLDGVFQAAVAGEQPAADLLEVLNVELARLAPSLCCLSWQEGRLQLDWTVPLALDQPLWLVVRSALDLLTSERLGQIKECEAQDCGWLFLDETRNHSRRWCEMSVCGNREKARRFRERRSSGPREPA